MRLNPTIGKRHHILVSLKKRSQFVRIAQNRNFARFPTVCVQGMHVADDSVLPQIGLTASRKVGGAVVRNRAKRRLRHAITEILAEGCEKSAYFVLIATPATSTCDFNQLKKDITAGMTRCRRYFKKSEKQQDPA